MSAIRSANSHTWSVVREASGHRRGHAQRLVNAAMWCALAASGIVLLMVIGCSNSGRDVTDAQCTAIDVLTTGTPCSPLGAICANGRATPACQCTDAGWLCDLRDLPYP
jgi:hypothetical protein